MEMFASSAENRSVVVPWILDLEHDDLDLEVHGCGCSCADCGCGCACGCGCGCSCSCDSTGANGDEDDDSRASDSDDGGESSLRDYLPLTPPSWLSDAAETPTEPYNPLGY